jgi:hypothetical protein
MLYCTVVHAVHPQRAPSKHFKHESRCACSGGSSATVLAVVVSVVAVVVSVLAVVVSVVAVVVSVQSAQ